MMYRVLSFGPTMKVKELEGFVKLIKDDFKERRQSGGTHAFATDIISLRKQFLQDR